MDPLIGRKLGDYLIVDLLRQGDVVRVYRGIDKQLNRYAAVKVIDTNMIGENQEEFRQRFNNEARIIARLRHPKIVGIYQFDQIGTIYFIAMHFIEGKDLRTILKNHARNNTYMSNQEIHIIIKDIADALDYAHEEGVIHRLITPSNIMVKPDGHAILIDFGLALSVPEGTSGNTFGVARYIAPEQAVSSANAVPQSDQYSLGIVVYEMLTNRVPFNDISAMAVAMKHVTELPPPPIEFNPNISTAVQAVLFKALKKDPKQRFANCREMDSALESAFNQESISFKAIPELAHESTSVSILDQHVTSPSQPQGINELEEINQQIPNLDISLRFPINPKEKFKGKHLSVEEWRVVSLVNPKNSIRQIAKANNMSDMEIRRIVYTLKQAGLVELVMTTDMKLMEPSRQPRDSLLEETTSKDISAVSAKKIARKPTVKNTSLTVYPKTSQRLIDRIRGDTTSKEKSALSVKKVARKPTTRNATLTLPLVATCAMVGALVFPVLPGIAFPMPLLLLPFLLITWWREVKDWHKFLKRFKWGDIYIFAPLIIWGLGILQFNQSFIQSATILFVGIFFYCYFQNAVKDQLLPSVGFVMLNFITIRLYIGISYSQLAAPLEWGYIALGLGTAGFIHVSGRSRLHWIPNILLSFIWLSLHSTPYFWTILLSGATFITTVKAIQLFQQKQKSTFEAQLYIVLTIVIDVILFTVAVDNSSTIRSIVASILGGTLILLFLTRLLASVKISLVSLYIVSLIVILYVATGVNLGFRWTPLINISPILLLVIISLIPATIFTKLFISANEESEGIINNIQLYAILSSVVFAVVFAVVLICSMILNFVGGIAIPSTTIVCWIFISMVCLLLMLGSISLGWSILLVIITSIHFLVNNGMFLPNTILALTLTLLSIWLWRVKRDWPIGLGSVIIMLVLQQHFSGPSDTLWYDWKYSGVVFLFFLLWQERAGIPFKLGLLYASRHG